MASSDCEGFAKPQGYAGKGAEGKGQGTDNWTLTKPIPSARVRGYPHLLWQVLMQCDRVWQMWCEHWFCIDFFLIAPFLKLKKGEKYD